MQVEFEYTVTYESGETRSSINASSANLTEEQFSRLVRAIKEKPELDDREELSDIIAELESTVRWTDKWTAMNGKLRTSALKRPRQITGISLRLDKRFMSRIAKYPVNLLNRPEVSMTIVDSNGTEYTITSWYGEVRVRHGHSVIIEDADQFIRRIMI